MNLFHVRCFNTLFRLMSVVSLLVGLSTISSTVAQAQETSDVGSLIEGMFDIGGLNLYMRCEGTGTPTVIYLHGYSFEEGGAGARGGLHIQSRVHQNQRFCVYDRRNVGRSDDVEGYWTGTTAVDDLHALLEVAAIEPPYVFLAASFGGLVAHIYASTYPDEVVGMLLLDTPVPEELELEALLPEDMRFRHDEDLESNERMDQLAAREEALALQAPDIPVTYILATPSEWPTMGVPEWDAAILPTIRAYVDSFTHSRWVEVESPHCLECFAADAVVEELYKLIDVIEAHSGASTMDDHPFANETAWIAYQTDRGGSEGVWLVHPDGTGDHEIAHDFAGDLLLPNWSPDGKRLVMTSRNTGGTEPLFEYDLETETLRQLFECTYPPCGGDDEPIYSPDGTKIAFSRYLGPFTDNGPTDCGLWIGDLETLAVIRVTSNTTGCDREYFPHWSPDGTQFTYTRTFYEGDQTSATAVYVINFDGSDEQRLTDLEMFAGESDWSPDGEWIVFSTYPLFEFNHVTAISNLYRMHPDGSGLEQLTYMDTSALRATQPRYTPNGQWIIFTAVTPSSRSLWVMPAEGGEPVVIARGGIYTHGTWQP